MKKILNLTGLDCGHCAAEFENIVKKSEGIEDAKVNFMLEKISITAQNEEDIENALLNAKKSFSDAEWE